MARFWRAACLGALLVSSNAMATVVTFDYTGTVTSHSGIFNPEASVGATVTGTFSFDDEVRDRFSGPLLDRFDNLVPSPNQALTSAFRVTLNVGTLFLQETATNSSFTTDFPISDNAEVYSFVPKITTLG